MNKGLKSPLFVYAKIVLWCYFAWIGSVAEVWGITDDKRYYLRNLSIKDGLSQNTVNTVLQDRQGFMWFGTKDGLNRFDGLSLKIFRREYGNPRSIGNNIITTLYEDKAGNLWVGTDAGLYIYQPEKEKFNPFAISTNDGIRIEETVTMIGNDSVGQIWIAVERQGIFKYDPEEGILKNYPLNRKEKHQANVQCFAFDGKDRMWIGFFGEGLWYSEDGLKTLRPFRTEEKEKIFAEDIVSRILPGPYNCLYVASAKGGLREINLTSGKVRDLLARDENRQNLWVRDICLYSDTEIWVGSESGVFIYNLRTNRYTHLKTSGDNPYALSDNAVYSFCKDKEGGMWIGSYFGGVDYYPVPYTYFEKYYPLYYQNSIHGKRVREFCPAPDGSIWIGTEDGGLNRFDPVTRKFSFFEPSREFRNVHALCMDGENLWIGTFSKGLKVLNTKTGKMKSYSQGITPNSLNDNNVFSIFKTSAGDIWLGTLFGLLQYNKGKDCFIRIPELEGIFIHDIKEDSQGNIWLATYANGAWKFDVKTKIWTNFLQNEKDTASLPYNKVLSIYEDSRRQVWLTTQGGGFCRYCPETKNFVRYTMQNGLPNDVVYQIVEDQEGYFWLTTNRGLLRFDRKKEEFKSFTIANGLLCNQFNYRSGLRMPDGKIYFGSIEGFIVFNPQSFQENKYIPPVTITDFWLFNDRAEVGKEGSPLKKSIIISDTLILKSNQNSFSFRIAALSYQAPEMNQLMYRLEGFDAEWQPSDRGPLITYSNLKHGDYVFRVKASNSDGVWNKQERILYISILPPFYLSAGAYSLYILLGIASVLYTIFYFRRRNARHYRLQAEKFEREKEREIYRAKIDFFTNVAHEIRTPLTLIKGPLENILMKKEMQPEVEEDLNIMNRNTERLLNLTNQLLDFRKTEVKGFRLNFVERNIPALVRETWQRFLPLAKQRQINFTLDMPDGELTAHVDQEAFTKMLSNLFSNAVKYAKTFIIVRLSVTQADQFALKVTNDGIVVPPEVREEIFKPFVQYQDREIKEVTGGSGIGLALARSLAELHQGSLAMTEETDRNGFLLLLPITQKGVIRLKPDIPEPKKREPETKEKAEMNKNKPIVLVVEDDPDMLIFLERQLTAYYNVLKATDGRKALETLDAAYVNIVVSDVVMPNMDGFELCHRLKSDVNYSHIPVVLLTAKTNMKSKIEGLEMGADAYIEKPFSVEFLYATMANLLQNREKLRETYARSPLVASNTMAMSKADEEFLKKLHEIIRANLHNPDFGMDDVADALYMSRSSFYRKIRGLSDLTPNDYLRLERLKKAAELLQEGKYPVSEICYLAGFNTPSYFTKCFFKQFGVLPKDFSGK